MHEIISNYNLAQNKGIEIENYKSDLPLKKGLSSSASICVLTARAFNLLHGLEWTKKREMDIAYRGEIKTPSRCGKLDQACAYPNPILIIFDGDDIEIKELKFEKDILMLVVDLNKGKNTRKILAHLNKGFPFPTTPEEKDKHDFLGPINRYIVKRAAIAIEEGDSERLGNLMNEAQDKFDRYLAPHCPEELTAPKLHEVLRLEEIQPLIYGGKCVGSGGDGSVQFVCKSAEDRIKLKSILESRGCDCLDLDLKRNI